jgi:hypothetical protein
VKRETGKSETVVSAAVMVVLGVIAAGVFFKQFQYDPTMFSVSVHRSEIPEGSNSVNGDGLALSEYLPEGMAHLTPMEFFDPNNLSDKINGKAELYLSAGFVELRSQRFVQVDRPDAWMEVFIYDMGAMENSYSVYSTQRRTDAENVDVAQFAYLTKNAIFFVRGREYVEIVAATPDEELLSKMLAFAKSYVGEEPSETEELNELALFPVKHLEESSVSLLASDVFGFENLNNVWIAAYGIDNVTITAFLSKRESHEEAARLADEYYRFLKENGAEDREFEGDIPSAKQVEIFDVFEVVFSHNRYLGGVHEAEDLSAAKEIAVLLYKRLSEVSR